MARTYGVPRDQGRLVMHGTLSANVDCRRWQSKFADPRILMSQYQWLLPIGCVAPFQGSHVEMLTSTLRSIRLSPHWNHWIRKKLRKRSDSALGQSILPIYTPTPAQHVPPASKPVDLTVLSATLVHRFLLYASERAVSGYWYLAGSHAGKCHISVFRML
jgi:hypothetical protein